MSGSPSKLDARFDALMSLPNREDYPEVMGAEDVSCATGLPLKVVIHGAATARRLVERLIDSEAEQIAARKVTRLERDITIDLLGRARARMVPGKCPSAFAVMAHNLTLVTHNTQDYANVPGLRLVDWLVP